MDCIKEQEVFTKVKGPNGMPTIRENSMHPQPPKDQSKLDFCGEVH